MIYNNGVALRHFYRFRGLVKWYDRGLQNLWWEFDSLIPCLSESAVSLVFPGLAAFFCLPLKIILECFKVFQSEKIGVKMG